MAKISLRWLYFDEKCFNIYVINIISKICPSGTTWTKILHMTVFNIFTDVFLVKFKKFLFCKTKNVKY